MNLMLKRYDDGSFAFLGELIASPPEISGLRPVTFKTDREQIEEIVRICHKDHTLGMKHMSDDCVFIRPTGNPLDKVQWKEMMTNDDVSVESGKLVSINKLHVCGNMAFVCYTNHGRFIYKGIDNDDVAVITSYSSSQWTMVGCSWSEIHRRSPSEELPKFTF